MQYYWSDHWGKLEAKHRVLPLYGSRIAEMSGLNSLGSILRSCSLNCCQVVGVRLAQSASFGGIEAELWPEFSCDRCCVDAAVTSVWSGFPQLDIPPCGEAVTHVKCRLCQRMTWAVGHLCQLVVVTPLGKTHLWQTKYETHKNVWYFERRSTLRP